MCSSDSSRNMDTNSLPEKKPDSLVRTSASSIRRKRSVFNKEQLRILINHFRKNPYPGIEEREELSYKITIDESRIQVWFQNRRARQSAQKKKQASLSSNHARKWMRPENSSPSQIPREDIHKHDFSKYEFSLPNTPRSGSWSGSGELSPEAGSRCSSSIQKGAVSTTETACSRYNISQSHHFVSSQTTRPSTELQPCLPKPLFQGSSSQHESSCALQGTQRPENYGTHTSKPPLCCQQQGWKTGQLYAHFHPLIFHCAQESPCQLQQPPPALLPQTPISQTQQHTSSLHQSPQEHQSQTQPPPLMREEEQPNELLPSFNQEEQLQPSNLYKRTVGLGSTMLLPDGHLPAHQGDLDTALRDLDDILRDLSLPQGHLTAEIPNTIYKQINDLLTA